MLVVSACKGDGIDLAEKKYHPSYSIIVLRPCQTHINTSEISGRNRCLFLSFTVLLLLMFNLRISDDDEEQDKERNKLVNK